MKILLAVLLLICGAALVRGGVGVRKRAPITIHVTKVNGSTGVRTETHIDSTNYHKLTCSAGAWIPCFWNNPPRPTASAMTLARIEQIAAGNGFPINDKVTEHSFINSDEGWMVSWKRLPDGYEYIYTEDAAKIAQEEKNLPGMARGKGQMQSFKCKP